MKHKELQADVAIIGGGTGGCAAALAAARLGKTVVMTEETDWIGGQLTSQAVPPDEHPWIESFGCTRSYRRFRETVRSYYRRNFPLTPEAFGSAALNPGGGGVSRLCHEPRAALAALHEMMAPYVHAGKVRILHRHVPVRAEVAGDEVKAVTVRSLESEELVDIAASFFLDATECGDLLPLAGVEYVAGAESRRSTGEPHAPEAARPADMQGFTYCFAMDYREGENHTIGRPRDYDFWRSYRPDFWPGPLLGWTGSNPITLAPRTYGLFPGDGGASLWLYRRIAAKEHFAAGTYDSDITLVNWPQNDYWLGPIIDVPEEERAAHLERAKQLSLSLLYWMQTEAPRQDGKAGYPGLRLRPDVVGTGDGLAKAPYIRESRRIRAEFTVVEQHLSKACREEEGAKTSSPASGIRAEAYPDSIGIGCYRIDLHPSTGGRNYIDISSLPFQIPLGSLIPVRMDNVLPACKNIGTTHITNGCYRLHPVEWNIGEAAGALAAYCLARGLKPREVRGSAEVLGDFQKALAAMGVELAWPSVHAV
ncbi:FAD-dependent oxidoreductase [Paenibacillus hemerocallicola]|uniref:FAD-dependent oxidoreductase n=1 Tax=Paenibacillus hemerocallicola TaxID=1172614 RepID=A0A5C4SZ42_9BACL|nr:FAD-dependent oxidoreductase [Paenibacillus hemerocallicola]TNJ61943.1 FAD-dependent oxidoreductase [Paenibacillus hemerocallicola]